MPQILESMVSQLRKKGYPQKEAEAISRSQLAKHGDLTKGGKLTSKGAKRNAMGSSGRAKDRAAKASDGTYKPGAYKYNPKNHRATLKK